MKLSTALSLNGWFLLFVVCSLIGVGFGLLVRSGATRPSGFVNLYAIVWGTILGVFIAGAIVLLAPRLGSP